MKCTSYCVLAALAVFAWSGSARAETEAEYANPPLARSPAAPPPIARSPVTPPPIARSPVIPPIAERAVEQPKPKARPAARPATFAPAAAATAKRLTAEQAQERRFLREAAASSRFEAEAARLALGKSSDPAVRSVAATLINHHAAAGNELLHMLHARGMAAPMMANDQRKVLNRLARLQGGKFDHLFLEEVALKSQQNDVQQYEQAGLTARDPQLRAWIDRTLPTVRYQLASAERIMPAGARLAKAAGTPQGAGSRFVSGANLSTRSMGSGADPAVAAQSRGMQFGEPMQLGVSRPVANRPIESNTR